MESNVSDVFDYHGPLLPIGNEMKAHRSKPQSCLICKRGQNSIIGFSSDRLTTVKVSLKFTVRKVFSTTAPHIKLKEHTRSPMRQVTIEINIT